MISKTLRYDDIKRGDQFIGTDDKLYTISTTMIDKSIFLLDELDRGFLDFDGINAVDWVYIQSKDFDEREIEQLPKVDMNIIIVMNKKGEAILSYYLYKTAKRLTFDIKQQAEYTKYKGEDFVGSGFVFKASNGYEVISRSRMDIQTERMWLHGATTNGTEHRSGTMVFSSDRKRDSAFDEFNKALVEWGENYE